MFYKRIINNFCKILKIVSPAGFPVFLVLTIQFLQGCAGNEWARKIDWPDVDMEKLPTGTEYPGASAVILLDEGSIEVHTLSETAFSIFERHTILKILDPRGFKYANIAVPYSENSEVDEIEARTINPDGRITVLDPVKIYDVNLYPNFVFYSDQRAKIFTLPAVSVGSIIEYRYRLTINNLTYGSSWRFQSEIPVLKSRFTLLKQSEWEINYRMHGAIPEPRVSGLVAGFKQSMTWETGPLPALKSEKFMPPGSETGTRLQIAPFGISSWTDLSRWYFNLVRPMLNQRTGLDILADSLTAHLATDREKLQAIFQWTRDNIRYIAVEIGVGGYQPSPPEEVFVLRYGDCKDMTTLLCALAEEAAIPVYQALISTRQNGLPDTTLPAATQFNHVIAYAPTVGPDGIWMDATDKSCGFGALPWYDQNLPVLCIDQDGAGKIIRTPGSSPGENLTAKKWQIDLDPKGAADIETRTIYHGIIANEMRHQLRILAPEDQLEWFGHALSELSTGAKIDSFKIRHLADPEMPLEITLSYKDDNFALCLPELMVIEPGELAGEKLYTFFRNEKRLHPVRLQIPAETTHELIINLPGTWSPVIDKHAFRQNSPFGECAFAWEASETKLSASIRTIIPAQEIAPSEYGDFLEHLDSVRRILETPILIRRSR